jgi:tetratricopeptide (TPR) repeat protein/transcriptional regulator with XRE-family HTH domain
MSEDVSPLGARLRACRRLAGLSQEELAERSGVSVRTISNLERGRARQPYPGTRHRLADALGLRDEARAEFLAAGRRQDPAGAAVGAGYWGDASRPADGGPSVRPRHLPAPVPAFVGRRDQLAALSRVLCRPAAAAAIAVISGSPGVGKTALALRWAHDASGRFPDGQLYVDLRGYGPGQPVTAADALAGLLRALGMAGLDIPDGTGERAAAYRSLLAGRHVLVVLDNASGPAQVRPLLPGTGECAALVTSRDALAGLVAREGASRLELDLLPLEEAVDLLRELIGARVIADPRAAAALASYCSRLPLALRVAAELAVAHPLVPLARLAGQLADLRDRLNVLDAGGDELTAVQSVLSWSDRHLDAAAARGFRLLGQHPGPDFDGYAAAALTGATFEDACRLLDRLARAYLIHSSGPGRYGMHDLLRAYAREHAAAARPAGGGTADHDEGRRAALTRLFDYYLRTTAAAMDTLFAARRHQWSHAVPAGLSPDVSDPVPAGAWLDAELGNLVAAAAQMAEDGWPGHAARLACAVFPYLEGALATEAITIHGHALRASRRAGDSAAEATALGNLGYVFLQQGRYQQAASHLRQAVTLFRQAGDRSGEAMALGNLAVIDRRRGRYLLAAERQSQALTLTRQAGDHWGEALTLTRLGSAERHLGRYQQALGHLQQALSVSRRIGDPLSEAEALTRLGVVERDLGRYQQAADHHELAIALFRHGNDLAGEAEARDGLGELSLAMGQPERALLQHAAARKLAEQTGSLDEQARAHHGLACAHQAAGTDEQAQPHFEEAIRLYSRLGAPQASQIRRRPGPADGNETRPLALRKPGRQGQAAPPSS